MKIALIQCPVWGTYDPPLAIAQLSGCLRNNGQEVFVFDLNIKLFKNRMENYKDMWAWEQSLFWYNEENVDKFFSDNRLLIESYIKEIIGTGIAMVGFSVSAASRLSSFKVARMIKDINKEIVVIFGGPLFFERKFIEEILNEKAVDIVIPGEGEVTFIELIHFLENKRDISNCKGISFKNNGKIINTAPRELISNLDSLPFLDFSDLPLSDYDDPGHIVFMASRGCIQRCVFCSSRSFWTGYRAMSGRRIFEEIALHKLGSGKINNRFGHVDFIDLMFNGNMKYLIEFCDLMIKAKLGIFWTANMIIRPELTPGVIKKIKDAGCEHVIFGIESGSQRVLELMKKHYRIEDADRIISDMHQVGIVVTGNFMFGFPGETEDDFKMTLDFLKRNAGFLDRAYPSRTYCAIEESSYLAGHLDEFNIKPNPPNHLFWESVDGNNTYPIRLKRCQEFSRVSQSLGIEVGCGVQTSVQLDELFSLFQYYEYKNDREKVLGYLLAYFDLESSNEIVNAKIKYYFSRINDDTAGHTYNISNGDLLSKLTQAVYTINHKKSEPNPILVGVKGRTEKSIVFLKSFQNKNSKLNSEEFSQKKLILQSFPTTVSIQIKAPYSSKPVFLQNKNDYELFDPQQFKTYFENELRECFTKTEQIIFDGIGEFFLLPYVVEILDYFDKEFPHVVKVLNTDGLSLSPNICEKIVNGRGNYTLGVTLPASNSSLYSVLMRTDNFEKVLAQLKYLLKIRKDNNKPALRLNFVITTLNIDDLPNFIKFAADLGADRIVCSYSHIFSPVQKYLSCFFRQAFTNKILIMAEEIAQKLHMAIDLPPKFDSDSSQYLTMRGCRVPWSKIRIDSQGYVSPCERMGTFDNRVRGNNFMDDVWNAVSYQNLRQSLIEDKCPYLSRCLYTNASSVNEFATHVLNTGVKESIDVLWADNF